MPIDEVMTMKLYMYTTLDLYELPVAVAETKRELKYLYQYQTK